MTFCCSPADRGAVQKEGWLGLGKHTHHPDPRVGVNKDSHLPIVLLSKLSCSWENTDTRKPARPATASCKTAHLPTGRWQHSTCTRARRAGQGPCSPLAGPSSRLRRSILQLSRFTDQERGSLPRPHSRCPWHPRQPGSSLRSAVEAPAPAHQSED